MRTGLTFFLVMLGWVIFRSNNLEQLQYYAAALIHPTSYAESYIDLTFDIFAAIITGTFLVFMPLLPRYLQFSALYQQWKGRLVLEDLVVGSLGLLTLCKVVGNSYTPFLYFKF